MGQVRTLVRAAAVMGEAGPAEVLRCTDAAMRTLGVTTTATAVVLRLEQEPAQVEARTTTLRWSSAGHPPPLVLDPHGAVGVLGDDGQGGAALRWTRGDLLLGVEPALPRHERALEVARGTTVLLYTDGLVERRGESMAVGLERLLAVAGDVAGQQASGDLAGGLDTFCDTVLARMLPDRPQDDVALVAVRLHPQDRPRPAEAGPQRLPDWAPEEPAVLPAARGDDEASAGGA